MEFLEIGERIRKGILLTEGAEISDKAILVKEGLNYLTLQCFYTGFIFTLYDKNIIIEMENL